MKPERPETDRVLCSATTAGRRAAWRLRAALVATAVTAVGACAPQEQSGPGSASAVPLLGTEWHWQAFEDSADGPESNDLAVSDPAAFTLRLEAGTAAIRADCNFLSWPFALEGSSLRFETLGPTTMAYCGDDSLDRRFLALLADTATYVLRDATLYLNLRADAGNLVFVAAE